MADKNSHIDAAQRFLQKGQLDRAIKEYYRALEQDPRDYKIRHKLGELLARQGTRSEALKEFGLVADAYAKDGFYLKAIAVLKQVLKLKPDLFDVQFKLGTLYQQLSLLSEALEHFKAVAEFYEHNGTAKECIEVFSRLVELSPDDLHSRLKLAEYYIREEKNEEAIKLYQTVAAELSARNRQEELARVYERLIQLKPDDLELLKTLARLYVATDDAKRALGKLQICFKADPSDTETLSLLGETFMNLRQVPKALSVYKELARIYAYQGLPEREREVFERIRRIDPQDADALRVLGLNKPVATEPSLPPRPVTSPGIVVAPLEPSPTPNPAVVVPPPLMPTRPIAVAPPTRPVQEPEPRATPPHEARGPVESVRSQGLRPEASAPIARDASPAAAGPGLREVPASVARLMTEVEVYLKYNLVEKAIDQLKQIADREPACYVAREKRRDLLIKAGRAAEAALESSQMSMLASSAGEYQQAGDDLEQATRLDPDNLHYQHALASLRQILSRMSPPRATMAPVEARPVSAPVVAPPPPVLAPPPRAAEARPASQTGEVVLPWAAPPPDYRTTNAVHILIEEDDEELVDDEAEDAEERAEEADLQSIHLGSGLLEEEDLVDDGEGASSIYLSISEDIFGGGGAEEASQVEASPPPLVMDVFGPPREAPRAEANPPATPAPPSSLPFELDGGIEPDELVDDSDEALDLIHELEAELGHEAAAKGTGEVELAPDGYELAQAYFQMGLHEQAIRELERLRVKGSFSAEGCWLLGRSRYMRQEYTEAVRCFQSVLNRNDLSESMEVAVLYDLAVTYEAQQDYQLALNLLEEIAGINEHFRPKDVRSRTQELERRLSQLDGNALKSAR